MAFVKALHVLCVFVWIGNLLALTRLMGYQVKEAIDVQLRMAKIYRRMYLFVGLPTMTLSILLGLILLPRVNWSGNLGWFYLKMGCTAGLVACDLVTGKYIRALQEKGDTGRGVQYKILHGMAGIFLIGVLSAIYLLKPKFI